GDPALAAAAEVETPVEDGYSGLQAQERRRARTIEENPGSVLYSLTILWGNLYEDADTAAAPVAVETTEWNGSLVLSDGAIRVLSRLGFERWEDRILPRSSRDSLAWESVTADFYDGLRVMIVVPADSSGAVPVQQLSMRLNDVIREYTTADLEDLDELIEVGESARISLRAFRIGEAGQVQGFCNGYWGRLADEPVGTFRGAWISESGRPAGFMRGHYGVNQEGDHVFFGKYIGHGGRFGGFLRGTWEVTETGSEPGAVDDDSQPAHVGRFRGQWVDRHGVALGDIKGHWASRDEGRGVFNGIWSGSRIVPAL
ncbi:MAG: hypothetical protein V1774_12080, partial [Candidatus Eisenbacteria bacterium]